MQVSRSGYYSWKNRQKSTRDLEREVLIPKVKELHQISRGTYGKRRMAVELEAATGIPCGVHKAGTLMKLAGVQEKDAKCLRQQQTANMTCRYLRTYWPVILPFKILTRFMSETSPMSGR